MRTFSEPLDHELQTYKEAGLTAHVAFVAGVKIRTHITFFSFESQMSAAPTREDYLPGFCISF